MERKSIGTFIAILRKANGMTQKELAEKLGISDKAVSRWERDETAPDLSLLPAIAEIFGVTTDELLRGERTGEKDNSPEKQAEKTEKQIKNLLKNVRTKFFSRTLICVLIAVVGLFAAMICNFAFYRMQLGFIVGCIFFATAIVLEIIFAYLAYSAISDEEIESEHLLDTRRYVIKTTLILVTVVASLFSYCIPLLFDDPYITISSVKINFDSWFIYGIIFVLIALALCFIANIIIERIAEKKGIFCVSEKTREKRAHAVKIFAKPALSLGKIFLPIVIVTIIAHIVCISVFDVDFFLRGKGTEWYDVDEFIEYIENPVSGLENNVTYTEKDLYADSGIPGSRIYVCSYKPLNGDVYEIKAEIDKENGETTITTYTNSEYFTAYGSASDINSCFTLAYLAEGFLLIVLYTVKSVKAYKKEKEK